MVSDSGPGVFLQGLAVYDLAGRPLSSPNLPLDVVSAAFRYATRHDVPLSAFLGDICVTLKMHPEIEVRIQAAQQPRRGSGKTGLKDISESAGFGAGPGGMQCLRRHLVCSAPCCVFAAAGAAHAVLRAAVGGGAQPGPHRGGAAGEEAAVHDGPRGRGRPAEAALAGVAGLFESESRSIERLQTVLWAMRERWCGTAQLRAKG